MSKSLGQQLYEAKCKYSGLKPTWQFIQPLRQAEWKVYAKTYEGRKEFVFFTKPKAPMRYINR